MGNFTSIETLKKEHFLIERMLKIMNLLSLRNEFKKNEFGKMVEFIERFVEENHCAKEEEVLFPIMAGYEIVLSDVVQNEPERRREALKLLNEGLAEESCEKFFLGIDEFMDLFSRHIFKEEGLIFPAVEALLPETVDEEIREKFKEFEQSTDNKGYEYFKKMVDELESLC